MVKLLKKKEAIIAKFRIVIACRTGGRLCDQEGTCGLGVGVRGT